MASASLGPSSLFTSRRHLCLQDSAIPSSRGRLKALLFVCWVSCIGVVERIQNNKFYILCAAHIVVAFIVKNPLDWKILH